MSTALLPVKALHGFAESRDTCWPAHYLSLLEAGIDGIAALTSTKARQCRCGGGLYGTERPESARHSARHFSHRVDADVCEEGQVTTTQPQRPHKPAPSARAAN